jgi:hypothetical protein
MVGNTGVWCGYWPLKNLIILDFEFYSDSVNLERVEELRWQVYYVCEGPIP